MRKTAPSVPVLLLLLALLLLGGTAADAKLDGKAWRELKDRAAELFGQPGHRAEKAELLAKAVEDGLQRSRKLIVDAFVEEAEAWVEAQGGTDPKRAAKQLEEILEESSRNALRERKDPEWRALAVALGVRGLESGIQEISSNPMAKRTPHDQKVLRRLQELLAARETAALEQRGALDDVSRVVVDGDAELLEDFLKGVKRGSDWPVRAAAVRVAATRFEDGDAFEHLQRALEKDDDARVRMSALEALRAVLAERGESLEADVLESLDALVLGRLADPDWGVQLFAVQIVGDRGFVRAVPHLINALSVASPRVSEAIGDVLQSLTGENFDPYADVWAKWWEDNKERYAEEIRVQGKRGKREHPDVHVYGLPVKSDRVVFIIDTSKSMELPTTNENPAEKWKEKAPATGGDAPPPPPPPEEILSGPKIDVAKHELKKALKKLPPTAKFNVIAFNSAVLVWKGEMMDASDKNKEDALQWVRALEPRGSTYIDGALRVAFRIAGLGAVDKAYPEVNVDTIVLMSDGAPTDDATPDSNLMDPKVILDHVSEWNKFRRVVIHCIGIDIQHGIEFLQELSAQNGGEYVDR